jgi:uncharacterized protein (DUF2252 family)
MSDARRLGVVAAAALGLAVAALGAAAPAEVPRRLRPSDEALAAAPGELIDKLRADAYVYFRFVNRAWTARVCEVFADTPEVPVVRLHGDAHVEQFAFTRDAWGLDDFDDSARGAAVVDVVRFLGSLDLASRQRGWGTERDALRTRFFDGLRQGLSDPAYRAPMPSVVQRLRARQPRTQRDFLAWGEGLLRPLDDVRWGIVIRGVQKFDAFIRGEGGQFAPGYFTVVHAGWLRIGVGSATARKMLIRVQGPTANPDDDVLLEAKEVATLDGIACLQDSPKPLAHRIVRGSQQMGRLKHEILAVGPTMLIPASADRAEYWLEWWVTSWDPTYREVRLADLRSSEDLAAIAYDAGLQLGTGATVNAETRQRVLASMDKFEGRLRDATTLLVDELLAGWRELSGRRAASEAAR